MNNRGISCDLISGSGRCIYTKDCRSEGHFLTLQAASKHHRRGLYRFPRIENRDFFSHRAKHLKSHVKLLTIIRGEAYRSRRFEEHTILNSTKMPKATITFGKSIPMTLATLDFQQLSRCPYLLDHGHQLCHIKNIKTADSNTRLTKQHQDIKGDHRSRKLIPLTAATLSPDCSNCCLRFPDNHHERCMQRLLAPKICCIY